MKSLPPQLEQELKTPRPWFHSIDVGNGVVTPGRKTPQILSHELETMHLPDLRGRTVLDVGAWDGFFSFEAERRGASRVVSLDHFVWSIDAEEKWKYREECKKRGVKTGRYEQQPKVWRPDTLPGKRGYDLAHRALDSKVECKVADFLTANPADLGVFDVVFFTGVLYHMENPLQALKWLASVTGDLAIIETAVVEFPGYETQALAEFYEQEELNGDPTNWWAPNRKALEGMCRAAGFEHVEFVAWPWDPAKLPPGPAHGRGVVHACKKMPLLPYALLKVRPLPEGQFKTRIKLETSTLTMPRNQGITVPVSVSNGSSQPWTPERKIHLSYHVLDENGAVRVWDGARSCLPRALQPGGEAVVDCHIAPFGNQERCEIEFDLVQEQVGWFKAFGSATVKVPCSIAPGE